MGVLEVYGHWLSLYISGVLIDCGEGVEKAEDRLMVLHFAGAIQASIVVAYAPTEVSGAPSKDINLWRLHLQHLYQMTKCG